MYQNFYSLQLTYGELLQYGIRNCFAEAKPAEESTITNPVHKTHK